MKFGLTDAQVQLLTSLLKDHLPDGVVVLVYGSRAMGNYTPRSDIDLVIKNTPCDRYTIAALTDAIDESDFPLLCDVQCYEQINNAALKNHINRVGKMLLAT